MTKDSRWWKVAGSTIPGSLLATAFLSIGFNLAVGNVRLGTLVDTFFVFAVAGPMFFGVVIWLWGVAIGWLVWPVIWNLPIVLRQTAPVAAAISAFVVAFVGGVVPFGLLFYQEWGNFAVVFLIPAIVATVVGPIIAFMVYRLPKTVEN